LDKSVLTCEDPEDCRTAGEDDRFPRVGQSGRSTLVGVKNFPGTEHLWYNVIDARREKYGSISVAKAKGSKAGNGKGRRGGVTGKGFVPGQVNNPHGRPRDLIGFRERCRERTLEVVEILECVFFTGRWPNRTKFVSDAVRMSAGAMLVSNGWGTPPNSTDIRITMPQLLSRTRRGARRDHRLRPLGSTLLLWRV
jgi:hypothetical protein